MTPRIRVIPHVHMARQVERGDAVPRLGGGLTRTDVELCGCGARRSVTRDAGPGEVSIEDAGEWT